VNKKTGQDIKHCTSLRKATVCCLGIY